MWPNRSSAPPSPVSPHCAAQEVLTQDWPPQHLRPAPLPAPSSEAFCFETILMSHEIQICVHFWIVGLVFTFSDEKSDVKSGRFRWKSTILPPLLLGPLVSQRNYSSGCPQKPGPAL